MRSTYSAARRHLEEAHRLLVHEDELSAKSRQALEILIDAFLAAEFSGEETDDKIVSFPAHRISRR